MRGGARRELLERDAELAELALLLDRAEAGSGGAVLIEGEAGVGKTALLEQICDEADSRGMTVLTARGGELEREFAWGVARQLFEPWLTGQDEPRRSEAMIDSAALAQPVFGDQPTAQAPEESFSALHGLYWLTVNISRDKAVLIAVDDLHWADLPSLRFVVHLTPRLDGVPVVLLATVRPPGSESAVDAGLLARLTTDPGAAQLRPAPLTQTASRKLVQARQSRTADPEFCQACHEMTGGNPFLLTALLDALVAEHAQPTRESAAQVRRMSPGMVARSVLIRLATLPDGCLGLVRAVAVLGARAEFRQARRLAGLERDAAIEAMGALARSGILRGESVIEFVHPLVRSAVYTDLAPVERSRWHTRAAELQAADGAQPEEIAHHLVASIPDGDPTVVQRLRDAAAQARARGVPELAADYLSRALIEPPPSSTRAEVLFELGSAELVQNPAAAISHLQQALDAATVNGERAEIALALGGALAASGGMTDAIRVFNCGLADLDDHQGDMYARLQAALLATARWERSAQSLRHEIVAKLQARASAGERLDPLLHAQLAIEIAASGVNREAAIMHARAVLDAAPELTLEASTVPEVALVLTFAGCPEEAWQATQIWLTKSQRLGWPLGIATASACAALTALQQGLISQALASARGATTPGTDLAFTPITAAFLIEALIERGDTAGACEVLAQHSLDGELPLIWPTTPLLLARGRLRAASGDHARAVEDLFATSERLTAWGVHNPAMTPWRSSAAISLAAIGERSEATRLAAEELELAQRWGTGRAIGIALCALGIAQGDADGVNLLAQAVSTLQDVPAPVEHARSLVELGAALRRLGTRNQAREHLRRGLDLAHRYGAIALADRAREELLIAGARPRRDALRGRDALTSSEYRVAVLAADGRTNTQIAQLLFITTRTVETHLTSSYAKLGIRSRRELRGALQTDRPSPGDESA